MKKIIKNKKGTGFPIEMIVIFLVVLIVGFLMINIFRSQIVDKEMSLSETQRSELIEQEISNAKLKCRQLCSETILNKCSDRDIVEFCSTNVGPLDLNKNGDTTDFNKDFLPQVGTCEDKIYCPLIYDCECPKEVLINLDVCENKLTEFWTNVGVDVTQSSNGYVNNSQECVSKSDYDASILWSKDMFSGP